MTRAGDTDKCLRIDRAGCSLDVRLVQKTSSELMIEELVHSSLFLSPFCAAPNSGSNANDDGYSPRDAFVLELSDTGIVAVLLFFRPKSRLDFSDMIHVG